MDSSTYKKEQNVYKHLKTIILGTCEEGLKKVEILYSKEYAFSSTDSGDSLSEKQKEIEKSICQRKLKSQLNQMKKTFEHSYKEISSKEIKYSLTKIQLSTVEIHNLTGRNT